MIRQMDGIPFCKFSASANDFIVIDNRDERFSKDARDLARRICARRYSVGADGLILIQKSDRASVRVRYFNPDGQEFSTCGNGGRCAARFTHLSIVPDPKLTMETNVGVIEAEVTGNSIKLQFVRPSEIRLRIPVIMEGREFVGHCVQLGDPHFVVPFENIRQIDFVPLARRLRHHESFGAAGTNVHFVEWKSRRLLKIRSFEKGVEDETLACGSGCVASAVSTFQDNQTDPPIRFEPHSGIPLIVHFQPENHFEDVYLEGDARLVYRGEFTQEALSGFPL